eukprot:9299776-Pyramimonas_sp.AAC.1
MKKLKIDFFEKCLEKLSPSTLSTLSRKKSSRRFPAETRLAVHRWCQLDNNRYLVELFGNDELEDWAPAVNRQYGDRRGTS